MYTIGGESILLDMLRRPKAARPPRRIAVDAARNMMTEDGVSGGTAAITAAVCEEALSALSRPWRPSRVHDVLCYWSVERQKHVDHRCRR